MEKREIAIFGGAFNPPINSHILLAKNILYKYPQIEKLIFVPVSTRYQKDNLVQNEHRYNMLKLICNKEDKLEVSNIELISKKQPYTIQTLDKFKQKYKNYNIYFIMGTDNLKELQSWKEPERILKNYKIIVLERENDSFEKIISSNKFLNSNKKSLIKLEGAKKIHLSSTIIREKIKNSEEIDGFIDKDVLKYIKDNNLYK
ncbi:MAG: nicotinate (nicotinamide) nucleotide adenylyltransferase [Clostridia bacterium]|nr:nicotinate (nicotinamide) nucleotide adenylyltransferase [Clostridia bacterium]